MHFSELSTHSCVQFQPTAGRGWQASLAANSLTYSGGVGWIVALDFLLKVRGLQWIHKNAQAKIHPTKAVKILGTNHGADSRKIAEHDCIANGHGFQSTTRLCEYDVVGRKF
jgi:hypothetical protein